MNEITEAKRLPGGRDVTLDADVVVVGSGAGGAVVATELAAAGRDVLVLEEGGNVPQEIYGRWRPSQSLRHICREAGSTAAIPIGDTPLIGIMMGRTIGGSSVMTGGVCFRIPESIAETWSKVHGLADLAPEAMDPWYAIVEDAMNVREVPVAMRSKATTLFDAGARKLGYELKSMKRNTSGCIGHSRCNFGCPVGAKLSVDLSYLPRARKHGARIWSDVLVEKVRIRGGRAAGVTGRLLNRRGGRGSRFEVRANAVFLCAGTLHTPKILGATGVGRGRGVLGRNLTLHPSYRVAALFDEDVNGWDGSFQAAFSDHFEREGITLNAAFPPLNVLAAMLPGVGRAYMDRVEKMGKLAVFGALVHDEGGGRLWNGPGREPWVTYRMAPHDKQRFLRGIRILSETYFAAGAKQVLLPIFGSEPLTSPDQLSLLDRNVPAKLLESMSFHPLGSARMSIHEKRGIVQPTGESWDLPGLYVADGSVFPTSIGVNSQLPIMAMATRISHKFLEAEA